MRNAFAGEGAGVESRKDRLLYAIKTWHELPVCGPGDDPDEQTNVYIGHHHLLLQIQRLAAPLLSAADADELRRIEIPVDSIYAVYDARARLGALIPDILSALDSVEGDADWPAVSGWIVEPRLVQTLRSLEGQQFLASLCAEINSCFASGNLVATVLLMRAVLNYVPPIFGQETFEQVAAASGRSLKDSFETLEGGLRKVADFHTHRRIRTGDSYPSAAQVEPFKPQFELLLHEVIRLCSPGEQAHSG